MSAERESASARMEFEAAAAIHLRLNKLISVLQHLPEFVYRIDQMHAVIVQKHVQKSVQKCAEETGPSLGWPGGDARRSIESSESAKFEGVALFRVDGGAIAGPLEFPISGGEHTKSQSMEARIQAALSAFPAAQPDTAMERMEHLAILKRWCYRGSRAGEIFFADGKGNLPMRRLVRGISRVYKGEAPESEMKPAG
jgi:hypothetical protein